MVTLLWNSQKSLKFGKEEFESFTNLMLSFSFAEQDYEIDPCVQIMNGPAATTTAEPTEPPTTTQPTTTTSSGPFTAPVGGYYNVFKYLLLCSGIYFPTNLALK